MKYIKVLLILVFFSTLYWNTPVQAEQTEVELDLDEAEEKILEEGSLDELQHYWENIASDYGGYIPEINKTTIMDVIKNGSSFSLKDI